MFSGNYRLAWQRLRASKWHSMLTMFGIVVGIVSVVTSVSLVEGVKSQVINQSSQIGSDLITVRPGNFIQRDSAGNIVDVDTAQAYGIGSGSLSEQDILTIKESQLVDKVSPISILAGSLKLDQESFDNSYVVGTSTDLPVVLKQKIAFGTYFDDDQEGAPTVVIGKRVAEQLFRDNVPIGESLNIRGQEFVVRGVFDEFGSSVLGQGVDLNRAVFIPRNKLKSLAGEAASLSHILVVPKSGQQKQAVNDINKSLVRAHGNNEDVTVIRQDENLAVASGMLSILNQLVITMAVISLLVGGIGIMNIMLVSVSERTHEIGIRKAIGATNRQIRNQFMAEAVTLSLVGGVIGIILSFLTSFIIRVSTNLHPVIAWPVVAAAVLVAVVVGVVFGTVPAVKAARKDPIEALRIST